MDTEAVHAYLTGPFAEIKSWCNPRLWQAIQPLADAMAAEDGIAPVAEIGIHHGKFFIGLVKTMGAPKDNYAIDVFDMQRFNLDDSGSGSLNIFRTNLALVGVPESAVQIVRADSMAFGDPAIRAIQESVGGFAFFSVDGSHMTEHTMNDFEIACRLTRASGVIFVDDYYNPGWPGVQEGIAKLFLSHAPRFVPLLYTCNKLFLCHISYHKNYLSLTQAFLREHFPTTGIKRVKRFGYDGLTLTPNFAETNYLKR
jgi:hypothetical protein